MAKKATTTKPRHTKVEPAPPLSPPPPAWRAADRCPDPAVRVLDPRFEKYYLYNARVERLAEGFRWAEGPVWFGDGRTLKTGNTTIATSEINFPNGLCFSPDETRLYVVESGSRPRHVHVFDVVEDGTALANGRVFIDCGEKGRPDGIRCDVDGNLWAGWGEGPGLDGVVVFAPDGDLIGQILLPERCANLCFGGLRRNRLFMASYTSLYSLFTNAEGIPGT
jgi:sugar lactone lactonase YvrE